MTEQKNQTAPASEQAQRAKWETPELHRLDADEANGAGGTGGDNTVFS